MMPNAKETPPSELFYWCVIIYYICRSVNNKGYVLHVLTVGNEIVGRIMLRYIRHRKENGVVLISNLHQHCENDPFS